MELKETIVYVRKKRRISETNEYIIMKVINLVLALLLFVLSLILSADNIMEFPIGSTESVKRKRNGTGTPWPLLLKTISDGCLEVPQEIRGAGAISNFMPVIMDSIRVITMFFLIFFNVIII